MTAGSVDQYGETDARRHRSPEDVSSDGSVAQRLHSMRPPESMLELVVRRFRRHRLAVVALCILLAIAVISFAVPLVVSEDAANRLALAEKSQPPSLQHPFGTDEVGRDIFCRSIFGGRISLRIGFIAALISVGIGMAIGALAGYNRGWLDSILMRFTDALLEHSVVVHSHRHHADHRQEHRHHHGGYRRIVLDDREPARARQRPLDPRAGFCPRGARNRRSAGVAPYPAYPAQYAGACDRCGNARRRPGNHHGGLAELPGSRSAAANRDLGEHALPGAKLPRDRAVDRLLSRLPHPHHGPLRQLHR